MIGVGAVLALGLVTTLAALDRFEAKPAEEYSQKQSQGAVTVAVEAYPDKTASKEIFGKAEPNEHGVLPVLVVISNKSDHAIKLENLTVRYVPSPGQEGIEAMRGADLTMFQPGGAQPKQRRIPVIGTTTKPKVKKGPLARPEIADREWAAPVVPPGVEESGFFFFNVGTGGDPVARASIYITGLHDMNAGQDLFYFEIPLAAR